MALLLITLNNDAPAQKIIKAELLFKGIKNVSGQWQLCFTDRKYKGYLFSVPRSNTAPYIFYSTGPDGSLKENEKVKGSRFMVSFASLQDGKTVSNIIVHVEVVNPK